MNVKASKEFLRNGSESRKPNSIKIVSVPCCSPQILHGIARDETRLSAAKIAISLHYTHMQYTYIV